MPAITSNAPGKTILFGEHAVVYGFPAIAVPITSIHTKTTIEPAIGSKENIIRIRNHRWKEDLPYKQLDKESPVFSSIENFKSYLGIRIPPFRITISSTIPISAGLGSSAAVAVSIIRSLSKFVGYRLSDKQVSEIAYLSEVVQHGTPSGIDNSVISFQMPVFFMKGREIETIRFSKDILFVLADSEERTPTIDVVTSVRERKAAEPDRIQNILKDIGDIAHKAKPALEKGSINKIGDLMIQNHNALVNLGVSSSRLDSLVETALLAGAKGAKLCGGGRGGFMVSVCDPYNVEKVVKQLSAKSPRIIYTMVRRNI